MDSIKDYLKKLEIKNDFLYKKLSDVLVTKVVYYKENKIFYIYLSSKEIISYDILSSLREALLEELDYFSDIRIKMRYNGLSRKSNKDIVKKNWDNILHTFSGAMIGALGFSIVTLLNKTEKVPMELSPLFVALFSFCFAVTLGVVWEFYEYTFDGLLGLNMQKFALENGTPLIGRAALADTMMDLVVDAVGAFIMSVIGYISLKYNKGWIERLQVKMTK